MIGNPARPLRLLVRAGAAATAWEPRDPTGNGGCTDPVFQPLAFATMGSAAFFDGIGPIGIDPRGNGGEVFREACFTVAVSGLLMWRRRGGLARVARTERA